MKKDLKVYFSLLLKYLKGHWKFVSIGIFLGIVAELCSLISPLITRFLMDFVIIEKNYVYFSTIILLSIVVLAVLFVSSIMANFTLIKVFKLISARLKLDIFKNLQNAPIGFYEREASGGISYRLLGDTDALVDSFREILVTIPMQLILLVSAVFMVRWNLVLAMFAFVILGIQAYIIARFRNPILNYVKKARTKGQEVSAYTVGHFRRIELVKALFTEAYEQKNFFQKLQELISLEIKTFMISKFSNVLQSLISSIWSLGILFYGGMLTIQGKMTIGTLMAFMMFTGMLYQPIAGITNLMLSYQSTRVSLARVKEYLEIKPGIVEKEDAIDFYPGEGRITVENVSFSFGNKIVLSNTNVEFPPNSINAIVGPTGSGKTTLAKLIARFFDPDRGKILMNGVDIKDIKISSLRKSVMLFLSDNYIFNSTLFENIAYGSVNISEEKLRQALKEAAIDFLDKLPNGLNTIIGEGGINLSSGEAQRISLARALLLSPKVFIFDEPTSSVDLETEKKINNTFLKLKQNSTVIIIAHRLSTAKIADRVVVLENGNIKGIGNHEELIKENNFYRKINAILIEQK